MDEWVKKLWCAYNSIIKKKKKEGNLVICNNMDGPQGHYASKKSQMQKDKYHMIFLLCGI